MTLPDDRRNIRLPPVCAAFENGTTLQRPGGYAPLRFARACAQSCAAMHRVEYPRKCRRREIPDTAGAEPPRCILPGGSGGIIKTPRIRASDTRVPASPCVRRTYV